MSDLMVTRKWHTDLEPGTWFEFSRPPEGRIIAGFVFVSRTGAEYRGVDGKKLGKAEQALADELKAALLDIDPSWALEG